MVGKIRLGIILILIPVVLAASLVSMLLPEATLTITPEGRLSMETSVALAVNTPPEQGEFEPLGSPDMLINPPTTDTGGWTNPTRAYDDDGTGYANIISGTPSATHTYGNYGFSLAGTTITQVRVRYDAWSIGDATAANQQEVPTSDANNTGAFTVSPLWSKVDETTPNDTDYITGVTNGGGRYTGGFTAFSVPAGATVTDLTVYFRMKSSSTAAKGAACLKVDSTYYSGTLVATTTGWVTSSYAWANKPARGS